MLRAKVKVYVRNVKITSLDNRIITKKTKFEIGKRL